MEITVSRKQARIPVTVLRLAGLLDSQTYQPLIDSAGKEYISGARSFLLDLNDLTYISRAGLAGMHIIALLLRGEPLPDPANGWNALKLMERSRDGGMQKHMKLLKPRPEVKSVLELVRFLSCLEALTDAQKALRSF